MNKRNNQTWIISIEEKNPGSVDQAKKWIEEGLNGISSSTETTCMSKNGNGHRATFAPNHESEEGGRRVSLVVEVTANGGKPGRPNRKLT